MSPAARGPGWAVITILKSRLRLVYLSQILHALDGSNRGQHQQQCKAAVAGSNIRREGRQELQGQGYVARIQKHTAPHASQAPIRAGEGCGQGLVEDRSGCCTTTCIDNESIKVPGQTRCRDTGEHCNATASKGVGGGALEFDRPASTLLKSISLDLLHTPPSPPPDRSRGGGRVRAKKTTFVTSLLLPSMHRQR